MKVFYSTLHAAHAPAWYLADGTAYPVPEVPARVEKILAALQGGHELVEVPGRPHPPLNVAELPPAIRSVHRADYLEYLRTIHAAWTAEFGRAVNVLPDTFPPFRKTLRAAPPAKPSAQAGYYCFDLAAPITVGTFSAAVAAAQVAIAAADAILAGQPTAYALCRPPGHHAGPDYCGGFCYLNNAAIAAAQFLAAGKKRVAILDADYHHGNGTQDIFHDRSDVLFVSIHADPNTQYPYFWGYADETGDGPGKGFTLNLPLPRGSGENTWFDALATACARIAAFRAEALIVSLGVDTVAQDTVGDFHMTFDGFERLGRTLKELAMPVLFVQEGGYALTKIGQAVAAVLKGYAAG